MEQMLQDPTHSLAPRHLEVIKAVALEPTEINESWLQELGRLTEVGSTEIVNNTLTLGEREEVIAARQGFAGMMGFVHPDHKLHRSYSAVDTSVPCGLKPIRFLDSMSALTALSGSAAGAIQMAQDAHILLRHSAKKLRLRHSTMQHLTTVLDWQGDVAEFVLEKPKALMIGHKKLLVLGRLAARYGNAEEHKDICHTRLYTLLSKGLECHLAGLIIRGKNYSFGQFAGNRNTSSSEWRTFLYQELADSAVAEVVGYDVLRAYFRRGRPTAATLKKYPHLAFLQYGRRVEKIEPKEAPQCIRGDEAWLKHTSIPAPTSPQGKKGWITKINNYIAVGSKSIARRRPDTPLYEEVVNARIMFFRLLGWTSLSTEVGKAYEAFATKYHYLVPPDRMVALLNLFTDHGVEVNDTILTSLLYASKQPLERSEQRIEQIVAQGLNVAALLQRRPTVLCVSTAMMERMIPANLKA